MKSTSELHCASDGPVAASDDEDADAIKPTCASIKLKKDRNKVTCEILGLIAGGLLDN